MSYPQNPQNLSAALLAPVQNIKTLANMLESMKAKFAEILPRHVTADRIIKTAMIAVNRQPKLLECTQTSIMQAMMQAAELGLDASGGTLGQGYLVPFRNKVKVPEGPNGRDVEHWVMQATFIPGYRGLCDLARRGGEVRMIEAHVVYRGDVFDYEFGQNRKLRHVPGEHDEKDEDITHAYAVAWLSDTFSTFDVMTRTQLNKIQKISKAGEFGPWKDHYPEMARKTVIRRFIKYLPISSERLSAAVEYGDNNEFGRFGAESIVEGVSVQRPAPTARLNAKTDPKSLTNGSPPPAPQGDSSAEHGDRPESNGQGEYGVEHPGPGDDGDQGQPDGHDNYRDGAGPSGVQEGTDAPASLPAEPDASDPLETPIDVENGTADEFYDYITAKRPRRTWPDRVAARAAAVDRFKLLFQARKWSTSNNDMRRQMIADIDAGKFPWGG